MEHGRPRPSEPDKERRLSNIELAKRNIGQFDFRHQVVKPSFCRWAESQSVTAHSILFPPFLRIYSSSIIGTCLLRTRNS
jgi:hypothetical protein